MKIFTSLLNAFKKSSLFRDFVLFLVLVIVVLVIHIASVVRHGQPYIAQISPNVAQKGDVVVISGKHFGTGGKVNDFIEIAGNRLTHSSYLEWTDTQIKIQIPSNIEDGLVFVTANGNKSNEDFFANAQTIPQKPTQTLAFSEPIITAVSPKDFVIGQSITISGANFGLRAGKACVIFDSVLNEDGNMQESIIPQTEITYEYWDDSQIILKVPDGATTGHITVQTTKGKSSPTQFTLDTKAGTKSYNKKRTYLMQIALDVDNTMAKDDSTLTLHLPCPLLSSVQPTVELTDIKPAPLLKDYNTANVQQINIAKDATTKARFSQNFAVDVFETNTKIIETKVLDYADKSDNFYKTYTNFDELVPSNNKTIIALSQSIIGTKTNPYTKAKLIYNYMVQNYKIAPNTTEKQDLLQALQKGEKELEPYNLCMLYCALLRSAKVVAVPIAGLLIDENLKAVSHWWTQFFIQGVGWIPTDISLGMGMKYNGFKSKEATNFNAASYYFCNLDAQHIAFSKGVVTCPPVAVTNKIVRHTRLYSFQPIWEEASNDTIKYSILWNTPIILGIY